MTERDDGTGSATRRLLRLLGQPVSRADLAHALPLLTPPIVRGAGETRTLEADAQGRLDAPVKLAGQLILAIRRAP